MEVKVYIDLDDTLVDTSKEIEKRFNYKNYGINTHIIRKNIRLIKDLYIWQHIKTNPGFWETLPKREAAQQIYDKALSIAKTNENVYILTALPKLIFKKESTNFMQAAENKIKWVKKHFPHIPEKNILVVHAVEKKNYATDNDKKCILFDDSLKNVKAWKNCGGIAYFVTPEGFREF